RTAKREEWRGRMSKLQLIVPNPMVALNGLNQSGEVSHRCLENTGARQFLVVEFDTGTMDEHAALLLHLAEPLRSLFLAALNLSMAGFIAQARQRKEFPAFFATPSR